MALTILPLNGQSLNVTRDPIRQNFIRINADFLVNHGEYGLANAGKHIFLQMPEQAAGPATAINEGALYTKQGTTSAVTEMFFRRESSGTEIAMTECGAGQQGWTMLPSGIMLQWGWVQTTNNQSDWYFTQVNFPHACLSVQITPKTMPATNHPEDLEYAVTGMLPDQFELTRFPGFFGTPFEFFWLAIGY